MKEINVSHEQASQLFHNKFVVVLGDSIQRGVYKDIVLLLQKDRYLSFHHLKRKGERSFESDNLIEGGCLDYMHNGTDYREVRQFRSKHHLVRFYFVTRIYSHYMRSVLEDFRRGPKPDVVVVNSCVWDISRYKRAWVEDYKENLHLFFGELAGILPKDTLVVWNLTMPLGQKIVGGFLIPEIADQAGQLRGDVIEANFYSCALANAYGADVLDLHFSFRFSLQHRVRDGIHWNAVAHRRLTSLLLRHAAQAWGVLLPGPLTATGHLELTQKSTRENAENIAGQTPADVAHPPPTTHRTRDKDYRAPDFQSYMVDHHHHNSHQFVMRNQHTRRQFAPYSHQRPYQHPAHHGHFHFH